jgi:ATP-binding cassette subfamily F protein uup
VERPSRTEARAVRKLTFKEKEELAGMETAILSAESKVVELEALLADPAIYRERAVEVPQLVAELEATRLSVERLYARWQELEAIAAGAAAGPQR